MEFSNHFKHLYQTIRELWNAYPWAQVLLLCYYPILYLEAASRGILVPGDDQRPVYGIPRAVLTFVIIGPLVYIITWRFSLWSVFTFTWNSRSPQDSQQHEMCSKPHDCEICKKRLVWDATLDDFDTNIETGLSHEEVLARRKRFGPHEAYKRRNPWTSVLRRCFEPAYLLVAANAVLALGLRDWWHLGPIGTLWILSVRIPVEQREADDVAASLMWDYMRPSLVLRDGTLLEVPTRDIVPGDIVHVSEGSVVPADGRVVVFGDTLQIDESSITGTSLPISKSMGSICYTSTGVLRGDAFLQVNGTGWNTFLGRTVLLLQNAQVSRRVKYSVHEHKVVKQLLGSVFLVIIGNFGLLGQLLTLSPESYATTLYLTVNMLLVVQKLVSTIKINTLRAVGAAQLTEAGCIAQNVEAIDMLAGVDVLCVDKTGTITENRLTFVEPYCVSCEPEDIILVSCLSARGSNEDSLERAMSKVLRQYPEVKARYDRYKVIDHQGYDYARQRHYTECLVESPDGERMFCARGGPEAILDLCNQHRADTTVSDESYRDAVRAFSEQRFVSLAAARRLEGAKWELLGVWPCFDPPRGSTRSALLLAEEIGVDVKLFISHPAAAAERLARTVGMESNVLDLDVSDNLPKVLDAERRARISVANVYADLSSAEQKEAVVKALQESNKRVAVTGDGVPDVPTLETADCGIAVAGSAEAAQGASDVVFVERGKGLLSLVQAVRSSRRIFQQIHSYLVHQTALSLHVLSLMLWLFWSRGEVIDIRVLLIHADVTQVLGLRSGPRSDNHPYQNRPTRWSSRQLLREAIPLTITFVFASCLGVRHVAVEERSQALLLLILLSDPWLSLLVPTDGRVWAIRQDMKLMYKPILFNMLITCTYVTGLFGEGFSITLRSAVVVWMDSIAAFVLAVAVRYVTCGVTLVRDVPSTPRQKTE